MKPLRIGPLVALASLVALAGISSASFQGVAKVAWLGVEGWQMCEKDGAVCLIESNRDEGERRWIVSSPTIKDNKGRFLGSDPSGRTPNVRLIEKAGENTRWVFEIVSRLQPGTKVEDGKRYRVGPSGYTFRAKMADGPFKGWYLSADKPAARREKREDKPPAVRAIRLVRGEKEATVFTFIDTKYYLGSG